MSSFVGGGELRAGGPGSRGGFPSIPPHSAAMRTLRAFSALAFLSVMASGCYGYRLMRPEEIPIPDYSARVVVVPEDCERLIARATGGIGSMSEGDGRMVLFCQQQQIVRAQEEELALKRLEAHAETANFALRVATVVVGATIAILAWLF